MTPPDLRTDLSDIPATLLATHAGLTPERLRELMQGEDAYAPRPADERGSAG